MIRLLNRAELLVTYDLDRLNQARSALACAGIDYQCKYKDRTSPAVFSGRGRSGTLGVNLPAHVEYRLYLQKGDLSRAQALL